jgi:hypothetical protein
MRKTFLFLISYSLFLTSYGQPDRWQQHVKYTMNIDMNVNTNKFTGKQKLEYSNNSNDALSRVFYHLYFNAFQPGSSMDVRSRELGKIVTNNKLDWDSRVMDRISKLNDKEIGYQKIISLRMNGIPQPFKYHETILEVNLTKPIAARSKVTFEMEFEAQVPLQIRRSGRDNPTTGVRYSMSQWYPKICEYDYEGWHPTPYIAREFYGVWGDFDVTINIDKDYKLGGTGLLVNASEIGWGYDSPGSELKPINKEKRTWHFVGNNVHDFVWAADPDYVHVVRKTGSDGPTIHVLFKPIDSKSDALWTVIADAAVKELPFVESHFGKYPYPQYSFIEGGDGGMEYPMATLLADSRLGSAFHEWMHSWYQMMLGTNESLYPWMDEGFTKFADNLVAKDYYNKSSLQMLREQLQKNPNSRTLKDQVETSPEDHSIGYQNYFNLALSGLEEPLTTHSDHYNTNWGYNISSYYKGEVFMEQLGYIVGAQTRDKILLEYYKQWRFKHPNANDFIRVAEGVSGMQLDWYKQYWINNTKMINYGIDSLWEEGGVSKIRLRRIGLMPMPIDLQLRFKDGTTEMHYIPLNLMFGEKPNEDPQQKREVHPEWKWTHPQYILEFKRKLSDLKTVEIDPSKRMADIDRKNNLLELNW